MTRPVRVLLVEDSPDDAELIVLALRKGGLDLSWERIETAEELRNALSAGAWDAVLSDHTLPHFGANSALEILRSIDPDLPFLVVSGTVGEEVATAMMRVGANDYILKRNLIRLAPALERELREAANRRARRVAERSAAHLAAVVESSTDAIISKTLEGVITSWNSAAVRLYGWTSAEAIGQHISLLSPPDKSVELAELMGRLQAGVRIENFETVRVCRDGAQIDVSLTISPIRDADGRLGGASVIARDIRERKLAEERLTSSETRYRRLFEAAQDGILIVDAVSGRVVDANPFLAELLGYSKEELLTKELWEIGLFKDGEANKEAFRKLQDLGYIRYDDLPLATRDGRDIEVEFVSNVYDVGDTRVIQCNIRDISERKRVEDALRLRDRAMRAATQGLMITDSSQPDDPVVYVSPGFERLTGYSSEEILGRNCRFLQGKDTDRASISRLRHAIQAGEPCTVEFKNYRKDGTTFWNELSISPVRDGDGLLTHFVGVQVDVTARRSLEEQFRQAQKMEAVGQLAGGVAHDFNNLLTIINGYSDLLLQKLPLTDPSRDLVAEILKAGERSAGLTRQLLAFSRQQVLAPKVLDLNEVVTGTQRMLGRLIGEDIRVKTTLAIDLWSVRADPGQMEQVLLNLAVNARDAMQRGGRLTIETRNVKLDEAYVQTHSDARVGPHVLLSVTDTGTGMTPEVKARIFEPFFTTKEQGKGTGLGLATVYGIAKQSSGHVTVSSEMGIGTTFKVYLPRSERAVDSKVQSGLLTPPRGNETVLLVEDEDGVRALTRHVLTGCGYTVLEAANGDEAIRVAARHARTIHILITDVVMPGVGGRAVAQQMTSQYPGLKVLFVSGYTNDAVVRHGVLQEGVNFLQKPFSTIALAFKVREVLDAPLDPAAVRSP